MSDLDGKLEPEAKDGFGCPSDAALVSIAISLKRIADAVSFQPTGPQNLWDHVNKIAER